MVVSPSMHLAVAVLSELSLVFSESVPPYHCSVGGRRWSVHA